MGERRFGSAEPDGTGVQDIVAALRQRCAGGGQTRALIDAAADEIERLRTELALTRMVRHSEDLGLYDDEEARRG